jgi:hypothetical protein
MKKEEYIERYGEEAWERKLERWRDWYKVNREACKARDKKSNREKHRKGGKHYKKKLEYKRTGLQGERERIRKKHCYMYHPFKMIIAPDSQIHHEWIPQTAEYLGLALVEANPHRYGIIDIIQILDGRITLLTEEEVKNGKKNEDEK